MNVKQVRKAIKSGAKLELVRSSKMYNEDDLVPVEIPKKKVNWKDFWKGFAIGFCILFLPLAYFFGYIFS